jgi:hypothetical protein
MQKYTNTSKFCTHYDGNPKFLLYFCVTQLVTNPLFPQISDEKSTEHSPDRMLAAAFLIANRDGGNALPGRREW